MEDFDSTKDSSPLLRRFSVASLARLILLTFVFACSAINGFAEEDEKETLSKEVLEAVDEFTEKASKSRVKKDNKLIEKSVKDLAEQLELGADLMINMTDHFPTILEGTQREWKKKFKITFKAMLREAPEPLESIKEWKPKSFGNSSHYASVSPIQTAEWTAALKASLSEEQFNAYQTAREEKAKKLKIELKDYFIRCEEMTAQRMQMLMDTETELLKKLVNLDEERSKQLNAASKLAIDKTIEDWIVEWKEQVYAMSDAQRKRHTTQQAYPSVDIAGKQNPKKHKAWTDGLAKIFTEAELDNTKKRRQEIRDTRSESLAMVLIDELQPFIGFTIEQRTKFTKLFAKPLLKLPDHYFVQQGNGGYYQIDAGQMFTMVSENAKDKILPLLDKGQKSRWKKTSKKSLSSNRYYSSGGPVEGWTVPPAKEIDETEAQRLITAYMYLKAKESLGTHLVKMEAKVDGVARIGKLDDKKIAMLRTAGKGAAQELAKVDITNMENRARQQFKDVTPADLPARLKQNSSNYYSNSQVGAEPQLWVRTVDQVLSEEQKKAWETESESAKNWNKVTQQAIMMTEIDKSMPLAIEKRGALEKIVTKTLDDYHPEINQMFSPQWHIQGYYGLVPLTLVTDEELGTILHKDQIALIRSREQGHFEGMLKQMKDSRKQRLKQEKKQKK